MMLMALPLLIFTLGLFTLSSIACLLYLVHWIMGSHFEVDSLAGRCSARSSSALSPGA